MPSSFMVVLAQIGIAAALLVLLVLQPSLARSLEGKILAIVALIVTPAIAAYGGLSEHFERSKSTAYCLSCHVMADYGKSLRVDDTEALAAVHYQNNRVPRDQACYSCHTDYGFHGNTRAKARGVKHVVATYFGSIADTIKIARRYRSRECLRCHLGARSFEDAEAHRAGSVPMADIRSGKASCLRSGCHHVAHRTGDAALWVPGRSAPRATEASWPPAFLGRTGADTTGLQPGFRP